MKKTGIFFLLSFLTLLTQACKTAEGFLKRDTGSVLIIGIVVVVTILTAVLTRK